MKDKSYSLSDVLSNPFARALEKDEPVLYDVCRVSPKDRQAQLCTLCEKWLSRNRQALAERVSAQRLNDLDEEVLRLICSDLEDLCATGILSLVLPVERKGGFLAFLLNRVIGTSFAYERSKQWKNADRAAEDVVTFLGRDAVMFPVGEWTFANVDHLDNWSADYDERQLKRLAKQKSTDFSFTADSTAWRSSQRRKELFELEMEHYLRDRSVLDSLPAEIAENVNGFCDAYFCHMARYLMPDVEYMDRVDSVFGPGCSHSGRKPDSHDSNTAPESYPFITTEPELAKKVMDKLNAYLEGKKNPRDVMMPIRAAMEAGVIRRITFGEMQTYFSRYCPSSKASVSFYTDERDQPYSHFSAYSRMVEDFKSII